MGLKPITRSRLSEAAVDQIKGLITSRELGEGSKLPSERQLVEQLQISRASVREALRILEIMGLVEVKPGKGAFVKGTTGDLILPLPTWISIHKENLHNHFEARLVLEPAAAGLAAVRASQSDLKALRDALDSFSAKLDERDIVGLIQADISFHSLIGAATGNKTIRLLMDTIARFLFEGWKASMRVEGRADKTVSEHEAIFQAISGKNKSKAEKAMRRHLEEAVLNLKDAGLE
jgi:GntR family transcriptional repressor for pyruvate dehydrogenase complex